MAHRQPSDYRFESEIQADLLIEFGSRKPMRVFRNNVGVAYPVGIVKEFVGKLWKGLVKRPFDTRNVTKALESFRELRAVRFSVVGSADILGILHGDSVTGLNRGRAIGIEVKMPGQALRPEQARWRDMFVKFGGLHITATCIEDVYVALEKEGIHCR